MDNKNILLIESNEFSRRVVEVDLIQAGYEVVSVSSYEEALTKIKDNTFGVIITEMAKKDFGQVIEVIRKFKQSSSNSRIIVATNYESITQAVAALREGAYDYIIKPFDLNELKLVIENALEWQKVDLKAENKEVSRETYFLDELTNIYNYSYFEEALKIEFNRTQRYPSNVSLILVDVDNFKFLTDNYGRDVASGILKTLGRIIWDCTRKTDYVCRYGPDEFAVVLPETKKEGAFILGTRLLSLVRQETFKGLKHRNEVSVSIGLSSFPEDAKTKEEFLHKAQSALSEAKKLGKNRIVFF